MSQTPPPYSSPPTNNLGLAAFILSIVGIVSLGILSPIALLLAFIALFKRPRGFAVAGFVVGFVGTLFLALWLAFFGFLTIGCINIGRPVVHTATVLQQASRQIDNYRAGHNGNLPPDAEGNQLISGFTDGWGHLLRYHSFGPGYEIRSAGPDGTFDTQDDITP